MTFLYILKMSWIRLTTNTCNDEHQYFTYRDLCAWAWIRRKYRYTFVRTKGLPYPLESSSCRLPEFATELIAL